MTATRLSSRALLAPALLLMLAAGPVTAFAQDEEAASTEGASATGETPEQERARLNAEQAAMAAQQMEANAANAQAVAEAERQKAEYEAALAKWEADVAACQANGTCAK